MKGWTGPEGNSFTAAGPGGEGHRLKSKCQSSNDKDSNNGRMGRNNLNDPDELREHIVNMLHENGRNQPIFPGGIIGDRRASSVLVLMGCYCFPTRGDESETCLLFNKRSDRVKQPGDLCFPGGRIAPLVDFWFSKMLGLPFFPLYRWRFWKQWRTLRQQEARQLAVLLAAALREGFEEMRLNPFGVRFLGFMCPEALPMFGRVLYPMVGWMTGQRQFSPNWEVEKVIHIPLREFLEPGRYACYRVHFETGHRGLAHGVEKEFMCFIHESDDGREVLWGVTFEIVISFLEAVFGFRPPDKESLPVIYGTKDERYLNGAVAA